MSLPAIYLPAAEDDIAETSQLNLIASERRQV